MSIVLHIFIKTRKFDCSFGVGTKICFLLTYILSARFQLENWNTPAWQNSAWDPFSSAQLGKFQLKPVNIPNNYIPNKAVWIFHEFCLRFDFNLMWGIWIFSKWARMDFFLCVIINSGFHRLLLHELCINSGTYLLVVLLANSKQIKVRL